MTGRTFRNVIATLVGRGLSGGLLFVFTPIYIALLGIETYGLIGLYSVMLGTLQLLDQAVSPVVVRTLAGARDLDEEAQRLQDTLRTSEIVSIGMALAILCGVYAAAPWLARMLLHTTTLPREESVRGIRLIGLVIAAQWPVFVYAGALSALGRMVQLSAQRAIMGLMQWGGGALLLWTVARRIDLLFLWQAGCFATLALLLRRAARRAIPRPPVPPRFSRAVVASTWRYAAGTLLIGILGTVLTQGDKLLVSRTLPLAAFAAYSLAFTAASVIPTIFMQPIMSVVFPLFTRLNAAHDRLAVGREYRRWTQLVVTVAAPLTAVLVFSPGPPLALWLHKPALTAAISHTLPWIALGTMLNVIMALPFCLQLVFGWTSLSSAKNIVLVPIYLAAIGLGIPYYGVIAGALAWFGLNLVYYIVEVYLMHRRLLPDVRNLWWTQDTLIPILGALGAYAAAHALLGTPADPVAGVAQCGATMLVVMAALATALPAPRALLRGFLERL